MREPSHRCGLAVYCGNGLFWLRLFGWGFSVKNTRRARPLFSDLYVKRRIGRFAIGWLRPY